MRVYNFPKNYGDNLPHMTKSEWEAQALEDGWVKQKPEYNLLSRNTITTPTGKLTMKFLEEQMDRLNESTALDWNKRHGYMTGQQWLDNFKKHIPSWSEGDKTAKSFENIYLEAAKNAARIE